MCGIVGIIRRGNSDLIPELRLVLQKIAHRGPDDSGIWGDTIIRNGVTFTVG